MIIDSLIEKIKATGNPTTVGLDTAFEYLPDNMRSKAKTLEDVGKLIEEFNFKLIDKLYKIVPSVKVQVAYYEMYGLVGMKAFYETLKYAKSRGLIVISDVKRNDISSTAGCYAKAYLGQSSCGELTTEAFPSDFMTVNGYLGGDGITPFTDVCVKNGKGIFVLVKTSNPSSGELQDLKLQNGQTIYERMGEMVEKWGQPLTGKYGYTSVGAVVGATHPAEAEQLRAKMPHTFFLVPGYGAQGGSAEGLTVCFDNHGLGAVVNNSRGILTAYTKDKYKGMEFDEAAYAASVDMREDIAAALIKAGKR